MIARACAAACVWFAAACAVQPTDPFDRGMLAARRGDLLEALRAFENTPASHPRHVDARIAATDVENRVRRGQQALLDGLALRAEGRDREAIASLHRARDAWPGLPSIDAWIGLTRDRWSTTNVRVPVAPLPAPATAGEPAPDVRVVSTASPGTAPASPMVLAPGPAAVDGPTRPAPDDFDGGLDHLGEDPIISGLVAVEARLGHGELELAVIDLMELARRHPTELRVQNRLARVLHQRALLRYGQGTLSTAIADWERVLAIQPDNRLVRALLDAVRHEAAAPL